MAEAETAALNAAVVPVTPFQQNCMLIWDGPTKKGAVIDPGGDVDNIKKAIEETGIEVEKIVLTHGHIDHAGGADELRAALGVKIEGPHLADKFLLEGLEAQGREYGLTDAKNVTPDRFLDEGDKLEIVGREFQILHCPGHSPGSLVYVLHEQKFIIMGDVLFQGSIGRTDFPYGDHDALLNAIKTKILPLGDAYGFMCGHGPGSTLAMEKQTNPFVKGLA